MTVIIQRMSKVKKVRSSNINVYMALKHTLIMLRQNRPLLNNKLNIFGS